LLPPDDLNPQIELKPEMLQKIGPRGTLRVEASDGKKTVNDVASLTMKALQSAGGMAFIVAINDYGDPDKNLPYSVADARGFRERLLKFGYSSDNIYTVYASSGEVRVNEAE